MYHENNRSSKKKPLFYVFLILLLLIGVFSFLNRSLIISFIKEWGNPLTFSNLKNINPFIKKAVNSEEKTILPSTDLSLPIFMYHYIRDCNAVSDPVGAGLSVSPEKFQDQLDLIQELNYQTITFNDLLQSNIPEQAVILTFDDGYQDFYDNAFPELQKRKMKAVVFIITEQIGQPGYLTETEIKELSEYGIEIGSHSITHPDLTKRDQIQIQQELLDSQETLENLTGQKIRSFCYPAGKYSTEVMEAVEKAGYLFGVTTQNSEANFENRYDLSRYRITESIYISYYLGQN